MFFIPCLKHLFKTMPTLLRAVFSAIVLSRKSHKIPRTQVFWFQGSSPTYEKNTWTFLRKSEIVSQATCNLSSGFDLGYPKNVKHLLSRDMITEIGI